MPKFACRDLGMDCDWEAEAPTVEELMSKIAEHAKHHHGMEEIPEELAEQVRKAIKESFLKSIFDEEEQRLSA